MGRYLARRAMHAVPVLLGISLIGFLLIRLVPGDPIRVMLGIHATPEAVEALRSRFGLDQPLPIQYLAFVANAVRLDFGDSIALHTTVRSLIFQRIGITFALVAYATTISLALAIPLAVISAARANRLPDHAVRLVTMVTFAMPAFWVGLLLIMVFSLALGLFPTSGLGEGILPFLWSLTLPAVTIGLYLSPVLIRTLRASMIESLSAEFVEAARARGLSERRVLLRHVLRTSLVTTVAIVGVNVGFLLSGAVVVETVFAIPGLGSLLVGAVAGRDFAVIQGVILVFGLAVIVISLFTDLVNAAIDPRIRL